MLTPAEEPRCTATGTPSSARPDRDTIMCLRPATPDHDVHHDPDHGLWVRWPANIWEFGQPPVTWTSYLLLTDETRAQEDARCRYLYGQPPPRPRNRHDYNTPRGANE